MPILVDVHTHLDHPDFDDDIDKVIERAKDAGIKVIIPNGLNPETNRHILKLAERFDIIKPALGIYPPSQLKEELKLTETRLEHKGFDIDEEIDFIRANRSKIIALGECGLDYSMTEERDGQKELFRKMIRLSNELNIPIIVHSRKAERDVIDILKEESAKKVLMHCFCGKKNLAKEGIDLGYYFSIPTNIVRAQNFQILTDICPLNQLLTETDAPYLSPFKEKRNEPAFIIEAVKKIAEIKKITEEDCANQIFMNYQKLFG